MEIGTIIRKARNAAKLTQEQAAESLGVSRQTISNWENGKSYPDIISVITMSDLYSVSLDHLLKEETSMKQTYKEYLEESTNTVKSRDRQTKLLLTFITLGIWVLSVIAFWLIEKGMGGAGFSSAVIWGALPVTFFASSFVIGSHNYFGKWKWLAAPCFGVLYALTGSVREIVSENMMYREVVWPDLTKFPLGLLLSAIGLAIGVMLHRRSQKTN